MMISVLVEETVPIIYQNQRRDVCVTSGMNATHCEQSHSNGTTTHSPNYTLFCNDPPFLSISTISYVLTTATACEGSATSRVTDSLSRRKRWYHNTTWVTALKNLVLIPANADVMTNVHPRSHGMALEKWSLC